MRSDRLRKENNDGGIVLSPQRRSFNSGCYVPVAREPRPNNQTGGGGNRPHSPLGGGKQDPNHIGGGVREIPTNTRRIGSGRIRRDSWDFGGGDKQQDGDNEYGFRGQQQRDGGGQENRRSFGRDFDMGGGKEKRNGRYGGRRIGELRWQYCL